MRDKANIPAVSVDFAGGDRPAAAVHPMGMRAMQERVWRRRGEQYLLIKSPPASGKSRALMFVALDKLHRQGLRQAVVIVPEKSIGASFADADLTASGFFADWAVRPRWNLCNSAGGEGPTGGKVDAVAKFLQSEDRILVCTHATFRFAAQKLGVEAFDDRLVAVDEFHHVSVSDENVLGEFVRQLIARGKCHIVAMTGSYFRGDDHAVLAPDDEGQFETVTYTYYEQLAGYEHLKRLDLGYWFYTGVYLDAIGAVLDPAEKTIVHIPSVNSRESTGDKYKELDAILNGLGEWTGADPETGFQLVRRPDGRVLRVADLIDDEGPRREKVMASLRDPLVRRDRDHVDMIVALGMAKEGFDWIWCEHALTVGYRSSLTEVVQIIGRATRDAPGKARARFTNLIANPDATQQAVTEAVNDTLKAIAASLLMEQVLAPRFEFRPKFSAGEGAGGGGGPQAGFDYGPSGYDPAACNVGVNRATGTIQLEIKGLAEPKSAEATRICREDLSEVIASFVKDEKTVAVGMFDRETPPQELTQVRMGKIVSEKYPDLAEEDQEAVRQHAVAALNVLQGARNAATASAGVTAGDGGELPTNTALVDGVRRFVNVHDLNVDWIDSINPFGEAYNILAKSMDPERLQQMEAVIAARKVQMSPEEAWALGERAFRWHQERGRPPSITSGDVWEKQLAEAVAYLARMEAEGDDE